MSMYTHRITYVKVCIYLYPCIYRYSYKIKAFFLVNTTHGWDGDGVLPTSDPLINSKKWVLFFFFFLAIPPPPSACFNKTQSPLYSFYFFFSPCIQAGKPGFYQRPECVFVSLQLRGAQAGGWLCCCSCRYYKPRVSDRLQRSRLLPAPGHGSAWGRCEHRCTLTSCLCEETV